jgi:hypothetical protein
MLRGGSGGRRKIRRYAPKKKAEKRGAVGWGFITERV